MGWPDGWTIAAWARSRSKRRAGEQRRLPHWQPGAHLVAYVKKARAQTTIEEDESGELVWMPTLNAFDVGDTRTTAAIIGGEPHDDPLPPPRARLPPLPMLRKRSREQRGGMGGAALAEQVESMSVKELAA